MLPGDLVVFDVEEAPSPKLGICNNTREEMTTSAGTPCPVSSWAISSAAVARSTSQFFVDQILGARRPCAVAKSGSSLQAGSPRTLHSRFHWSSVATAMATHWSSPRTGRSPGVRRPVPIPVSPEDRTGRSVLHNLFRGGVEGGLHHHCLYVTSSARSVPFEDGEEGADHRVHAGQWIACSPEQDRRAVGGTVSRPFR